MQTSTKKISKILGALSALAMLFSTLALVSCSSDSSEASDKEKLPDSALSSVSISGSKVIEATGTATLTAKPTFTETSNSSNVDYKWEISGGESYATLSATTGASVTLNGKNTDSSSHKVTVKVTASYGGKSVSGTYEVTIEAVGKKVTSEITSVKISADSKSIEATGSTTLRAASESTGSPSITYSWKITSGSDYASLSATTGDTVTLTANNSTATKQNVIVKVTASDGTNTKDDSVTITVAAKATGTATKNISASDTPVGYAEIDTSKFGASSDKIKTVTTKTDLVSYAKKGGYLIYVSGMIDMSDGMLPSTAGGTTTKLDSFVARNTSNSYTSYTAFRDEYAKLCSSSTNDKSSSSTATTLSSTLWELNKAYGDSIKLTIASDTAIIGLNSSSGIKGGTIQISDKSNIVIRNLTIQDAYDPFPHHEKDDGFNAEWDGIAIQSAKNIWIDHCTVEDTMKYTTVKINGGAFEKWQTYDGLCDIKKSSSNVVVSYNIFKNHDKTMLIGSSGEDLNGGSITIHHNKFLNCGQRLPMTTYPQMHIFNNCYLRDSDAYYNQQACIVGRYSAYTIVAENNYFGNGVKKCLTTSTSASGKCYSNGNYFAESSVNTELATATSAPFTPSYTYSNILETAANAKTTVEQNAGAGVWTVIK